MIPWISCSYKKQSSKIDIFIGCEPTGLYRFMWTSRKTYPNCCHNRPLAVTEMVKPYPLTHSRWLVRKRLFANLKRANQWSLSAAILMYGLTFRLLLDCSFLFYFRTPSRGELKSCKLSTGCALPALLLAWRFSWNSANIALFTCNTDFQWEQK